MEETENNIPVISSVNEDEKRAKPSSAKRKLDEMNAYLGRTDTTKLFKLIETIRAENKAKQH